MSLKSASPSTAEYPTKADDPLAARYDLISLAAALTNATVRQYRTHAPHNLLTCRASVGSHIDDFITNVESENVVVLPL